MWWAISIIIISHFSSRASVFMYTILMFDVICHQAFFLQCGFFLVLHEDVHACSILSACVNPFNLFHFIYWWFCSNGCHTHARFFFILFFWWSMYEVMNSCSFLLLCNTFKRIFQKPPMAITSSKILLSVSKKCYYDKNMTFSSHDYFNE